MVRYVACHCEGKKPNPQGKPEHVDQHDSRHDRGAEPRSVLESCLNDAVNEREPLGIWYALTPSGRRPLTRCAKHMNVVERSH